MMNWTLEEREIAGRSGKVLVFAGELTLPHAAMIREALLAAVECGEEVTVECAGVTAVDLCGLQLLCSAHRTASRDTRLTLARPLPPPLLNAVTEMGFTGIESAFSPLTPSPDSCRVGAAEVTEPRQARQRDAAEHVQR